jgi:hypothetical protein
LPFRWRTGVASSLNYIEISNEKSPVLHPYPNFKMNQLQEEQAENPNIVSSFGIQGDPSQFARIYHVYTISFPYQPTSVIDCGLSIVGKPVGNSSLFLLLKFVFDALE